MRGASAGPPRASRHALPVTGPDTPARSFSGTLTAPPKPTPAPKPAAKRRDRPTWPPTAGRLPTAPDTPVPPPDLLADTSPGGLHTFNLGYIPASVTPPRTWRRAAWFAIFSSGAALVGLLFVTSVLIGPVHVASDINTLPGLPTGLPFFTPPSASNATSSTQNGQRGHQQQPSAPVRQPTQAGSAVAPPVTGGGTVTSGDGPIQTTGTPVTGVPTTVVGTSPPVTTVNTGPPAVDPTKIGDRTEQFFSEVTSNVDAAADLTSSAAQDDAKAIIEQNYGDISSIQIKSISLDPSSGLTVSVLQVTNKDGSVSTQQRTLQFTLTGDPKIENPAG